MSENQSSTFGEVFGPFWIIQEGMFGVTVKNWDPDVGDQFNVVLKEHAFDLIWRGDKLIAGDNGLGSSKLSLCRLVGGEFLYLGGLQFPELSDKAFKLRS